MIRGLLLLLALTPAFATGALRWSDTLRQAPEWYAGEEARTVAAQVVLWQHPSGGWPKNTDLSRSPTAEQRAARSFAEPTIDNGGTTTPLRFLALVVSARPDPGLRAAFERGFDYLLAAQYENGGWPQFFPLKQGYYTHITYNDNAMVNVLTLLRDTAGARPPYAFVDTGRRARAAEAVTKGVACILRTQVKQDGKLTAWCAQHDERSFEPAWARAFEPPSLSGMETVGITRFLMGEAPSPEIVAAIEGAVAWLKAVQIHGLRVDFSTGADGKRDRLASAEANASPLWARFYELGTNRPVFLGRDSVVHYEHNKIERERRAGYAYLGEWPASLLEKDYPRWRQKHHLLP
ncbi:MAG TPA: pectate lyase [Lacunisphaera sp.]|nr:pectate lyase [Lacunisphaera sp.]